MRPGTLKSWTQWPEADASDVIDGHLLQMLLRMLQEVMVSSHRCLQHLLLRLRSQSLLPRDTEALTLESEKLPWTALSSPMAK